MTQGRDQKSPYSPVNKITDKLVTSSKLQTALIAEQLVNNGGRITTVKQVAVITNFQLKPDSRTSHKRPPKMPSLVAYGNSGRTEGS